MGCSSCEEIVEVFDALDAALDRLCDLSFDVLTTPERLRAMERLERAVRRMPTPEHALINQLVAQAGEEELGGTLRSALATGGNLGAWLTAGASDRTALPAQSSVAFVLDHDIPQDPEPNYYMGSCANTQSYGDPVAERS